ncbi:MAG: HMA2 domain-containing protein [Nitrospirota bacterium]
MAQDDLTASDVPVEGVSNPSSAPACAMGDDRSVSVEFDGPLAPTHVIHSIPGRVRLRVPTLKADSHLVAGLQTLLSAQAGVTEVTVATVCQSVTVVYDPAMWTSESLRLFLQSRSREELEQCASAALPEAATSSFAMTWLQPWRYLTTAESSPDSQGAPQTGGPVKSGYWKVGYASMVVGVAMLAVPGVPGVPFLILSTYCFSKATSLKTGDKPEAGEQVPKAGQ